MARVLEFVHRVVAGENVVRVWGKSEDLSDYAEYGRQRRVVVAQAEQGSGRGHAWAVACCEALAKESWVQAVEVTTPMGGVMVYPEWP